MQTIGYPRSIQSRGRRRRNLQPSKQSGAKGDPRQELQAADSETSRLATTKTDMNYFVSATSREKQTRPEHQHSTTTNNKIRVVHSTRAYLERRSAEWSRKQEQVPGLSYLDQSNIMVCKSRSKHALCASGINVLKKDLFGNTCKNEKHTLHRKSSASSF